MSESKRVNAKKNEENVEARTTEEEKDKARKTEEVPDESLEKVVGGVQPRPKQRCPHCGSTDEHTLFCPLRKENITPHL